MTLILATELGNIFTLVNLIFCTPENFLLQSHSSKLLFTLSFKTFMESKVYSREVICFDFSSPVSANAKRCLLIWDYNETFSFVLEIESMRVSKSSNSHINHPTRFLSNVIHAVHTYKWRSLLRS